MPSILTHALTGVLPTAAVFGLRRPRSLWLYVAACAALPDADVLSFGLGIDYGDFFGHRGFFHSLMFALVLVILFIRQCFPDRRPLSRAWWSLLGFFFGITASHGLLDALTDGGLGIALLSPFDATRYFFPWTPIAVSPMGADFFSSLGLAALTSELAYVWLPTIGLSLVLLLIRLVYRRAVFSRPVSTPISLG